MEDARPSDAVDDPIQRRDLTLLERARDGSLDAFNDLVECYQDHLFALVARMVPDRDQAGDAVQEAFFSAYRNLRSFRGGSVRSWLSRIAINAAMDQQRLKKRRPSQPYPELEDETLAAARRRGRRSRPHGDAGRAARVLNAALATITPDQRHAIVLFDVEGYDYGEIARDDRRLAGHRQVADPPRAARRCATASRARSRPVPRGGRLMPHVPTRHADHDPLLVAAYAAGDATGTELDAAQALVAACPDCADPPPRPARDRGRPARPCRPPCAAATSAWRPSRPPRSAPPAGAGCSPRSPGPASAFAGPLGTGLATLGLAGLLVAGGAGLPLGGAARQPRAAPGPTRRTQAAAPAAAPAAGAAASQPRRGAVARRHDPEGQRRRRVPRRPGTQPYALPARGHRLGGAGGVCGCGGDRGPGGRAAGRRACRIRAVRTGPGIAAARRSCPPSCSRRGLALAGLRLAGRRAGARA